MLVARQRATEARRQLLGVLDEFPTDVAGFQEFNRLSAKEAQSEAEADALHELAGVSADDDGSATEREAAAWIEAELRRLRGQQG